jgi:hypothetical protein
LSLKVLVAKLSPEGGLILIVSWLLESG